MKKITKRNKESKNSYSRLLAKKVEEESQKDKTWVSQIVWNLREHYLEVKNR